MPYYELTCLAKGSLGRRDLSELIRRTCRGFMDSGGIVTRIGGLGADGYGPRKLAYSIRRNQKTYETGYFVQICAFSTPVALKEVERRLGLDERVLRHLTLKKKLQDSMQPLPDIFEKLPDEHADQLDPQASLRKFMKDYKEENPDGTNFKAVDEYSGRYAQNDSAAVREVMRNLKAATEPLAEDPGLQWLVEDHLKNADKSKKPNS